MRYGWKTERVLVNSLMNDLSTGNQSEAIRVAKQIQRGLLAVNWLRAVAPRRRRNLRMVPPLSLPPDSSLFL